jgi:hypothetical protein
MKSFIGTIVTNEENITNDQNFNILKYSDYKKTNEIPTLLIGWSLVKEIFPHSSILNKKIEENIYWTFSPSEKRKIFEDDLKSFIEKSYNDYVKNIEYFNLDPVIYKIENIDELKKKVLTFNNCFTYLYSNKILYFYFDNKIISVDTDFLDFIGFDKENFINFVKDNFNVYQNEEKKYKNEIKYLGTKYLPYLIHQDARKNTSTSFIC